MLLIGVKEENGWLLSRWNLTYKVGWDTICKAAHSVYDYYNGVEILVNNKVVKITGKDSIFSIEESSTLTIRGISTIVKVPIMITFVNQTNLVDVNVACATEEFKSADYQKFNMSLGQYMDSIELAMYR
ncbi:MAG: hypothetical protein ACI4ES_03595 [Roseburia sp.]